MSTIFLNRGKNNRSQLLSVPGVKNVWQTKVHTTETLVPYPGPCGIQNAVEKFRRYKSHCTFQIPAEQKRHKDFSLRDP